MKTILKSKTFWASILQFIIIVVTWIIGDVDLWIVITSFITMLGAIFYRTSIDQNLRNFFNKFQWFRSKTVWTAVLGILSTVLLYFTDQMELGEMLLSVATALIAIFLRSAQAPEE